LVEGKRERKKGEKKSRAVLATFRRREMGQAVSISRTKNDFELVIRATKELEWILEAQFGAPNGKTVGLHTRYRPRASQAVRSRCQRRSQEKCGSSSPYETRWCTTAK